MGGKPKNPQRGQVSQQEKMEAEAALRTLKMKMANAKKTNNPPSQGGQRKRVNNANNMKGGNYGMNMGMDGMSGNNHYNDFNNNDFNYPQSNSGFGKPQSSNQRGPGAISGLGKKPIGNNINKNYQGSGMRSNNAFGGGFGVQGGLDNRPIGGGLTAEQMPDENEPTQPCPHCGRAFNSIAFPKHVKICQKVFLKKRKAFNTQKQRIIDSEQASLMKQGAMEAKRNPKLNNNKQKGGIPKWKLQSMEFRAICNPGKANQIRKEMGFGNVKTGSSNMKGGVGNKGKGKIGGKGGMNNIGGGNFGMGGMGMDMGGYVPSAVPLDYTHCKYCNRNYNEEAYNKHLNGCKRRYEEAQMRNKITKKSGGNKGGKPQMGGPKYNAGRGGKKK